MRRAALAGIVVPALLLVLPLYAYLLGIPTAIAHAVLGLAGATLLLEILLLSYEKVPFTCTYVPSDNLTAFGIPYTVAFLIGASVFAAMERAALQDPIAWFRLLGLLAVSVACGPSHSPCITHRWHRVPSALREPNAIVIGRWRKVGPTDRATSAVVRGAA